MAILAAIYALIGSAESLWVDELHSSWTISGTFSQIGERAAEGNQSPVYFGLLWSWNSVFSRTLGIELALRVPSILAWAAAIWLIARYQGERLAASSQATLSATPANYFVSLTMIVGWIALDRIQLFYATEARVYAIVQLLSLIGWLLCLRFVAVTQRIHEQLTQQADSVSVEHSLARGDSAGQALDRSGLSGGLLEGRILNHPVPIIVIWFLCSMLLIYLHLTAGPAVFAQWCFLCAWAWFFPRVSARNSGRRIVLVLVAAGAAVGLASLPAVWMAQSVWERREQWTSFAGDASFDNLLHLFPLLELLVPALIALCIQRMLRRPESVRVAQRDSALILWCVAAFMPWLFAWLVTLLEIAPVFHRRFVIVSALPLVLLAANLWNRIHIAGLKFTAAGAVIAWLVLGQGTFAIWRQGAIVGWQRAEGWREAARWVERRIAPEESLWVASGLIEGREAGLPLSDRFSQYLSYPLRGGYRVHDRLGAEQEPHALVNDWRLWEQQWLEQVEGDERLWIIYRGPADRLADVLEKQLVRSQHELAVVVKPQGFGRVAVAAVQLQHD